MEIKDLASKVELGTEMADVRGGSRYFAFPSLSFSSISRDTAVGNVAVRGLSSSVSNSMTNGDVAANTHVASYGSNSGGFSNIGSGVTYAPSQGVDQASDVGVGITSMLSGLNFS